MRLLFGKYWWIIPLAGVIVFALMGLVHFTRETLLISKQIYQFIIDWSSGISAAASLLLVLGVFFGIWETRRRLAINEIHNWARSIITTFVTHPKKTSRGFSFDEMIIKVRNLSFEGLALRDVSLKFGGELAAKMCEANSLLIEYRGNIENTESVVSLHEEGLANELSSKGADLFSKLIHLADEIILITS